MQQYATFKSDLQDTLLNYLTITDHCIFAINLDPVFQNDANHTNINQFNYDESPFKRIEYLQLCTQDPVYLSVDCLRQVENLDLMTYSSPIFRVQFENLSVEYPNTKFFAYFHKCNTDIIESAKRKYSQLFSKQGCKIMINQLSRKREVSWVLNQFPNNSEVQMAVFLQDQEIEDSIFNHRTHQTFYSITSTLTYNFKVQQEKYLSTQHLIIDENVLHDQYLSLESLSRFKISDEFKLQFGKTLKLYDSPLQCESPKNITLLCTKRQVLWVTIMAKILQRFCNCTATEKLILTNTSGSQQYFYAPAHSLYITARKFTNVIHLEIPLSCGKSDLEYVIKMLKVMKNLVQLVFNSSDNKHRESIGVEMLSRFAIEQMMKLRVMVINVSNVIDLRLVKCRERVIPISIVIMGYNQMIQYVIDTRQGYRRFVKRQSN
ncbi:hypothetical protein FGO68_gene6004 [Halteria grandinella]|uniref:Uncharacterized protein n=1 Tax=Halteria grandinella TaxID=5974 RepID=A0A8J8T409_HALGN|nr:hypothetical protein FGO68_gene6004 [Halteria grandinella]